LQSELQHMLALATVQGRERLGDARTAAANAYAWAGNPILGSAAAALSFAAVMAFETGGLVPGTGRGDTVPAMLTPGEAVLPKRLTDSLMHAGNDASKGPDVHFHSHVTNHVQTIDGDGIRGVLDKHSEAFTEHFHSEVRKLNK
jgi:hypothetical protein